MSKQPIHPGEQLALDLQDIGLPASHLAEILGVPQSRISNIINGKIGITADTALRLAAWQGTTPQYWMNLQRDYDLNTAILANGDAIKAKVRRFAETSR